MLTCIDCQRPIWKGSVRCKVCHNRRIAANQRVTYDQNYILERIRREGKCWIWTRGVNPNGYGVVGRSERSLGEALAHRLSYRLFVGDIPEGRELDHTCRNRACVNPDCLEVVTGHENMLRAPFVQEQLARTHCPQGHPYSPENTYRNPKDRRRHCRTCLRAANKRTRDKKRAGLE